MSYKSPRRRTSALAGGRVSNMPATIPEHPSHGEAHIPNRLAMHRDNPSLRDEYDHDYWKERRQEQYHQKQYESTNGLLRSSTEPIVTGHASSLYRHGRFVLSLLFGLVFAAMLLRFGESVLAWILPLAQEWENSRYGMVVFAGLLTIACNPLLFGHSSLSILGGFIYGFTKGSLLVPITTVFGSIMAFFFSRTASPALVLRVALQDTRLRNISTQSYKQVRNLIFLRFSLAPHQLVNGACATGANLSLAKFALGSAIGSVKLLIHVFIGSRLAVIAKGLIGLEKMDSTTKLINWLSIAGAGAMVIITGICIQCFVLTRSRHEDENEAVVLHNGDEDLEFERQNFTDYERKDSREFFFPERTPNINAPASPYGPT